MLREPLGIVGRLGAVRTDVVHARPRPRRRTPGEHKRRGEADHDGSGNDERLQLQKEVGTTGDSQRGEHDGLDLDEKRHEEHRERENAVARVRAVGGDVPKAHAGIMTRGARSGNRTQVSKDRGRAFGTDTDHAHLRSHGLLDALEVCARLRRERAAISRA